MTSEIGIWLNKRFGMKNLPIEIVLKRIDYTMLFQCRLVKKSSDWLDFIEILEKIVL